VFPVQIDSQAYIAQCSFLTLQREQCTTETIMHGNRLELVEAIKSSVGRNCEAEKISHEHILS
jgi:hypothetical protein